MTAYYGSTLAMYIKVKSYLNILHLIFVGFKTYKAWNFLFNKEVNKMYEIYSNLKKSNIRNFILCKIKLTIY